MRRVSSCVFAFAAVFALAVPVLPSPRFTRSTPARLSISSSPELIQVSGRITDVRDTWFRLELTAQDQKDQSVDLQIDDSTRISGKLKIGATADVSYRTDRDKNIAVSVTVTSS